MNSTHGEGSVFEFTLTLGLAGMDPSCCPENSACCVKPEQQPPLEHAKLTGAKIILVDTHPVRQVRVPLLIHIKASHEKLYSLV